MDLALCYTPAVDLARMVRTRQISPVELLRNTFARLDQVELSLNAFVARCDERALEEARQAEAAVMGRKRLGPLHGLPVSVKDLIEVAGLPCTYGSLTMAGYVAPADAPSVARLRRAGAIVIGKTTTSEFGYRGYTASPVHGVTRNVWDLDRTPGGSSGGAATSVAAGVTALALGTDGGGSIRMPCSFTNLVGIKAQSGRVPIYPPSATPTLAHVGPMTRSVDDAALLLTVIAGPDLRDHTSLLPRMGALDSTEVDFTTLHVAFSPTLGYARVDPEVARVVDAAVKKLAGLLPRTEVVEHVCADPGEILAAEFIGGCSARLGEHVEREPEEIDPPLLEAIRAFRRTSAREYTDLLRRRLRLREEMRSFFGKYDILLTPTTPVPPWRLGPGVPPGLEASTVWSFFTYPFNLTGQPACSVPGGFTEAGLPVGLQAVVRPLEEGLLVPVARALEAALDHRPDRYPLWDPSAAAAAGAGS